MKELTPEQQKRAIELLQQASAMIDVIRFEEGEEVDKNDLEGDINNFLKEVNGV
jgi:hypothetical protein